MPVVEYSNGDAIDHSSTRNDKIGRDPMTDKPYFYRGGVKGPTTVIGNKS